MMKKKVAVVTGASRGIGLAVACQLVRKNYIVYGICRHPGHDYPKIRWISCDVSKKSQVDATFLEILEKEKKIDVLVNNAGMGISGAAEFSGEEAIIRQLAVNQNGAIWCSQAVIPAMRKARQGKIVFISSLGAIFPLPYQSFYSVSKAGMNAFCDALRIELAPFGVQTCAVMLNDVQTEFSANRQKNFQGDELYGGRIKMSVSKMEASEKNGMCAETVARRMVRLVEKKRLPAHDTVGLSNKMLVVLYRLLPAGVMLKILGKIYG